MKKRWLCGLLAAVMAIGIFSGVPLRGNAAAAMTSSQEMVDVLKKMEGFAKYPYWDVSQYTVGYGTRCPDDKYQEYKTNGIPEAEAEALLKEHLASFEAAVNTFMNKYNLTLEQHQFDALVSLTYNCGAAWTRDINGYLNIAVRTGQTGTDFIYAMSLYSKASSDYVLIRRRLSEANMYLNGVYEAYNYSSDGTYPSSYRYVFLDGNGGDVRYPIHGYDGADPKAVVTSFSSIPAGVDEEGNPFLYSFAGWYTKSVGGTKIEVLDGTLASGTVLYAQWADPEGNIVALPKGEYVDDLELTVTVEKLNVRGGPGSFYPVLTTLAKNTKLTITEVYSVSGTLWGKMTDGNWIALSNTNYADVIAGLEEEGDTWPKTGKVTGDGVNVRNGAGTSYTAQYQLYSGDEVTVYEKVYDGSKYYWGLLEDGNWICLSYVSFETEEEETAAPTVTGITLLSGPDRTEYVQMHDELNLMGTLLQIQYSDGSLGGMTITRSMVTSYSNATLGETTVTAQYEGFSITFTVKIIKATVTFVNYDGTVLSSEQYAYGDTVTPPEDPVKPADENGEYVFTGWSPALTACSGSKTYTAVFELYAEPEETQPDGTEPEESEWPKSGTVIGSNVNVRKGAGTSYDVAYRLNSGDSVVIYETVYDGTKYNWGLLEDGNWICMDYVSFEVIEEPAYTLGDFDGNDTVDEDDAIYLLRHVVFPDKYPVEQSGDINGDGTVDEEDAIYLLRHVVFPEKYPLAAGN